MARDIGKALSFKFSGPGQSGVPAAASEIELGDAYESQTPRFGAPAFGSEPQPALSSFASSYAIGTSGSGGP